MKRSQFEILLEYIQSHFDEIETLLKMGLAQNLIQELDVGTAEFQPSRSETIILQAGNREWNIDDCRSCVIADYVSTGHEVCAIKNLTIYLKPEDGMIYYVVNESYRGSVYLPDRSTASCESQREHRAVSKKKVGEERGRRTKRKTQAD